MPTRLGIEDLFAAIPEGAAVTLHRGTPNTETRSGFYINYKAGLVSKTFFIGEDLDINSSTLGDFIIEAVG
jgi:hypothetical protein